MLHSRTQDQVKGDQRSENNTHREIRSPSSVASVLKAIAHRSWYKFKLNEGNLFYHLESSLGPLRCVKRGPLPMEWRGNLVKLGHAALQSMAEKSCVCVCVCVFLLQIQTPRYKHLFASVTLHPQTKAISFFFKSRYSWFTILYKFQAYDIVIHNF